MHVLQCPHDVDVHLLLSFDLDLDLHITCFQGHVKLWYTLSILTDGYHFALSAQKHYAILTNYLIIMYRYVLHCPHDVHVHLFCFDLHKFNLFLLRLCAATCPTSNCRCRTSIMTGACFLFLDKLIDLFSIWCVNIYSSNII